MPNYSYRIVEDFSYKDITVPAGYITNGADIPRLFWSITPPNRSDIMEAVVIHDYLCDKELYDKADRYFLEILQHSDISKLLVYTLYIPVVVYHFFRYKIWRI
jgi:hypothetical protein